MKSIISKDMMPKHNIEKYNFKVLGNKGVNIPSNEQKQPESLEYTKEDHPKRREEDIDSSALSKSSKDALIESLLKKTDEMSSNFIKLQMKLESMQEEHGVALEEVKKSSFSEGVEVGKAQAKQEFGTNYQQSVDQLSSSVNTLEHSAHQFNSALEGIKAELISAAIDISQEVINTELAKNSQEVAKKLSNDLIQELQSASKVTLKVNPKDYVTLMEHTGKLEHVEVVSDNAVNEGGVIAMSEAGNIDAQIAKRFERVKKAALSE